MKVSPQVSCMDHNVLICAAFSSISVISRLEILPISLVDPINGSLNPEFSPAKLFGTPVQIAWLLFAMMSWSVSPMKVSSMYRLSFPFRDLTLNLNVTPLVKVKPIGEKWFSKKANTADFWLKKRHFKSFSDQKSRFGNFLETTLYVYIMPRLHTIDKLMPHHP